VQASREGRSEGKPERRSGEANLKANPTPKRQVVPEDEGRHGPQAEERASKASQPHRVAVIGGDGIGPEVVAEALKVAAASGVKLETVAFDLGAGHYLRTGEVLPEPTLEALRGFEAILLGAVGPPVGDTSIPAGTLERGLLLRLRFELDLFVNLRPFVGVPGSIAAGADFAVVRENTEGTYAGEGGFLRKGTPQEIATQGSVNTRFGVERCVRFAFELAERRPARHLTLVHKTNVLTFAGDLWQRTVDEVARDFPDVSWDYHHVDAACIYLVEQPGRYDVIVTDNLFGDILTDLAGAVTGGIGYAASANLNPARTGPSLFEPVHGAAHDIAGTGRANPLAAIRCVSLLLEHLGEVDAAERVRKSVDDFVARSLRLGDGEGKTMTTVAIGDAIAERL